MTDCYTKDEVMRILNLFAERLNDEVHRLNFTEDRGNFKFMNEKDKDWERIKHNQLKRMYAELNEGLGKLLKNIAKDKYRFTKKLDEYIVFFETMLMVRHLRGNIKLEPAQSISKLYVHFTLWYRGRWLGLWTYTLDREDWTTQTEKEMEKLT